MASIRPLERTLAQTVDWNKARINFLAKFLVALIQVRTVNLTEIAAVFAGRAKAESHDKHIQCFLRGYEISYASVAEVTTEDIVSSNLILFGNDATNSLIRAVNAELPIRFGPTGIIRGQRAISAVDSGMVMIRPNPLNESRYVVIVGRTTASRRRTASRLRLTELPDYLIFDRNTLNGRHVDFLAGGFFEKHWQFVN